MIIKADREIAKIFIIPINIYMSEQAKSHEWVST